MATQILFIFTPQTGEDEPILTHIFQRGWWKTTNQKMMPRCRFELCRSNVPVKKKNDSMKRTLQIQGHFFVATIVKAATLGILVRGKWMIYVWIFFHENFSRTIFLSSDCNTGRFLAFSRIRMRSENVEQKGGWDDKWARLHVYISLYTYIYRYRYLI